MKSTNEFVLEKDQDVEAILVWVRAALVTMLRTNQNTITIVRKPDEITFLDMELV